MLERGSRRASGALAALFKRRSVERSQDDDHAPSRAEERLFETTCPALATSRSKVAAYGSELD